MRTQTIILTGALLLASEVTQARVWRVNRDGYSANYTGINALVTAINDVDSVQAGDTLHVEPSPNPYTGVTLDRQLVILGPGYFLSENVTPQLQQNTWYAYVDFIAIPNGISNNGTLISGIYAGNIVIGASDITIDRCRMTNVGIQQANATADGITIKRCFVDDEFYQQYVGGATPNVAITNLLISNCYFGGPFTLWPNQLGTVTQCVMNSNVSVHGQLFTRNIVRGGTTFQNNVNSIINMAANIFYNNPGTWLDDGTNHRNQDVTQFFPSTGSTDGKLNTTGLCSLCATHSIGMIYGTDPYDLSGIPNIPTIYALSAQPTVTQGEVLPVIISTRSND